MSKTTLENKKGKTIIINRLSYPETVNERIYNAIASGMFEGFLPVSVSQKRKETRIECVVQGLIPLTQYFNGIVTKKMFLDFVYDLAFLIKGCEKNMINANNLDLQSDRIFVDPQSKKVKCVYWPVVNNQIENTPQLFFRQLPYGLNFNPYENNSYLETYSSFFGGIEPFSINSFYRMVSKLSGKKSSGGYTTPSEALSGALSGNIGRDHRENDGMKGVNIEYDPFADRTVHTDEVKLEREVRHDTGCTFCALCGARNDAGASFCIQCGARLKGEAPPPAQVPYNESGAEDFGTTVLGDDSSGTTVLGYDEPEVPVYPTLIRLKTEESYSVDKPGFRIGKEQANCDLFIGDNNYISRSHAHIVTRDDRYYIVDQNSTNKTFVDGKVIPAKVEVEIFSGTQIRLANEDFTFIIES